MTGIWLDAGSGWQPLEPVGFPLEKNLHDSIAATPAMLPLPGQPRLVVLGREVTLGTGRADLVAVDVATGDPVVIEVKLATNVDRRQVLTQVLGYAASLDRSLDAFEARLKPYLPPGTTTVTDAVAAATQDGPFDAEGLRAALAEALASGRVRCVVVIDRAPRDLVELVGYLQRVTNDLLSIDLVAVSAYTVAERQVLVPQLVEPDRRDALPPAAAAAKAASSYITRGGDVFAASISETDPIYREPLRRLYEWARALEADGLAVLYSSTGKGRWVLNLRLPRQERSLVTIWNERGAFVSPYRSVLEAVAPDTLALLDAAVPGEIGQGKYLRSAMTDTLLDLLRAAFAEVASRRSDDPSPRLPTTSAGNFDRERGPGAA